MIKSKSKPAHRLGSADVHRHGTTSSAKPRNQGRRPVTRETAGPGDISTHVPATRSAGRRPEADDLLTACNQLQDASDRTEIVMPQRVLDLIMNIGTAFGNYCAQREQYLNPHQGRLLAEALLRSPVRPASEEDLQHYENLIELLQRGMGFRITGRRNARDSHLSINRRR